MTWVMEEPQCGTYQEFKKQGKKTALSGEELLHISLQTANNEYAITRYVLYVITKLIYILLYYLNFVLLVIKFTSLLHIFC